MNREKVVGENFREGSMEVAFELWTEQMILSRLQRRFPPLSREAISECVHDSRIVVSAEVLLLLFTSNVPRGVLRSKIPRVVSAKCNLLHLCA